MKLTILQGDIFQRIAEIPSDNIDLCITSPPYWGLRAYGAGEKELGSEPTMEAYLDHTLRWVKEVWRVLKPTGSFVLDIGDCFIGGGRGGSSEASSVFGANAESNVPNPPSWADLKKNGTRDWKANSTPTSVNPELGGIYKTKQLLSVSSFAYCRIVSETDFVCRGEHIWCKPAVPSPIRSRLKHSHEKLFWFVKDADKYYFDPKPWMRKTKPAKIRREVYHPAYENIGLSPTSTMRTKTWENEETIEHSWRILMSGAKQSGFELAGKRNSEHIAPFPENLIRPYIESLCPPNGIVLDPFLGSGTTMRVAMENQRNCIGIELSEKYVKYAKKRLNWGSGLDVEYQAILQEQEAKK